MKKTIILSITILIVLTLFCTLSRVNKKLSKNDFISLIESFKQVSNVKIEGDMTQYIKDEYILTIRKDGLYTWGNAKTKECIGYFPTSKTYSFLEFTETDIIGLEECEYTFLGYEKYDNTKCAIAEFKYTNSALTVKVWVDAQKGTCLKVVNIGVNDVGEQYEIVTEYTATYDVVTDEDVKRPDLTEYTIVENNTDNDNLMEEQTNDISINDNSSIIDEDI